jgi:hypothetical protein
MRCQFHHPERGGTVSALDDIPFQHLVWEREWRRCSPSSSDPDDLLEAFIYFCENYWYINHPGRGRIKFTMYEAQVETARMWITKRYSIVLKARQIGFSTLVAAYAFWITFFWPDRKVLMLSRTEREAIKLLSKAKYGYRFLPEWMRNLPNRAPAINMTQTRIEMTNESLLESLPSASDPARGEAAFLVVVDELAFLPNSDEAYAAIEPVADVGGRIIMLSTANGEGNLFHRLWVEANAGLNRFTPLFFSWSSSGRDQEWYEAKKRELPDWQMAQEYPDNPDDAFLRSGRPVFNLEVLREIETRDPRRGYLDPTLRFVEDGGALRIWDFPEADGVYVIGADPSQGLEHSDYASAHVINARTHEVVAHWHGHIDPDLFGTDVLARLGRWFNSALVGVESNNHGLTTLKFLQRVKYRPIYYERSPKYKRSVPTDVLGFRTTQVTKPLMIDELNSALRHRTMVLHCADTIGELRTFVRNDKGRMHGSPYDDRTISLAIANQMCKYVWLPEFAVDRGVQQGSAQWVQQTMYGDGLSLSSIGTQTTVPRSRPPFGRQHVRIEQPGVRSRP